MPEQNANQYPVVVGYEIRSVLGKGPLGTVYRARNLATKEVVSFRAFARPQGADQARWNAAVEKFRASLVRHQTVDNHPNIQKVITYGHEGDIFYVINEYFEADNLRTLIDQKAPFSYTWVAAVFKQVAQALDYAYSRGLAHTDLTPYNILITKKDGAVSVINFGLARTRNKAGSPYVSPEQLGGWEGDRISDVYGAGAVMYEMLTGRPPFQGTAAEIVRAVKLDPPPPMEGQPVHVRNVIRAMMDKDRFKRYPTVSEAVSDLERRRSPRFTEMRTARLDPNVRLADARAPREEEPSIYDYDLQNQDADSILGRLR